MTFGSMPNDGGFLILSEDEITKVKNRNFIKKYIGASLKFNHNSHGVLEK